MVPLAILMPVLSSIFQTIWKSNIAPEDVKKWVGFFSSLFGRFSPVEKDLQALEAYVKEMVAAKREPTMEEWEKSRAEYKVAHNTIQAWEDEGP